MKYLTVFLIKGDAGKFQRKMLYELAKKFNIGGAIQRDPPPHITLKYSFETDNIKEIESLLNKFCKKQKPTSLKISSFGHFGKDVIFIKVKPSKEMLKVHKSLLLEFHKISWMRWHKHDENSNFHASIAHSDIAEKFNDIWKYIKKYNPEYELMWNNITLFKLINGKWKIHKQFKILK
jgi:2'-5' RNA ligase